MTAASIASTHTFQWKDDVVTAIHQIAEAGYRGVELMGVPPHVELWGDTRTVAAAVSKACRRAGLTVSGVAVGSDPNLASPDGAMRAWSLDHYERAGRLAAQLGASYLVVHPGRRHPFKPAPFDSARGWVVDGLTRIATAMHDTGVRPVLENTPSTILDTAEECADVVREVGIDRSGICYSVANGTVVESPEHGLRTVAELLQVVHVSDSNAADWRHDPIGTGLVDIVGLASTLDDIGYAGPVVVDTIHRSRPGPGLAADRLALHDAGWMARGAGTTR